MVDTASFRDFQVWIEFNNLTTHVDSNEILSFLYLGVESLTLHEIHTDLVELQRLLSPGESDSDGSVDSENIVESFYPVKPRKGIRIIDREEWMDVEKSEQVGVEVEEALRRLDSLMEKQPELVESEIRFEDLHTNIRAYTQRLSADRSSFLELRESQQRYLKVLQGFSLRLLSLSRSYQQQLSVQQLLLASLRRSKEIEAILQDVRAQFSAPPKRGAKEREVLRVQRREGDRDREVFLVPGMSVITPFGMGKVIRWDVFRQVATLQLPFGVLSCSLSSLSLWIESGISLSETETLFSRCDREISRRDFSLLPNLFQMESESMSEVEESEEDRDSPVSESIDVDPESVVRKQLRQRAERETLSILPRALPLLLAPPQSLSVALKTVRDSSRSLSLSWDSDALASRDSISNQSSLWRREVSALRSEHRDLVSQLSALQREQKERETAISLFRSEASYLAASTSAIRLKMFTRRHSHRTLLNLQTPMSTEAERERPRSRRSNSITDETEKAEEKGSRKRGRDVGEKERDHKREKKHSNVM